jgi:D-glycero-D-manno-heptose 1,7-bisphosphate phosphatase
MNKALFLDRDGVINKNFGHVHRIEKFKFRKGIFDLVKLFQNKNYLIFVITNQAGIGKGLYSLSQFTNLNDWMINEFRKKGLIITKTYYCPHKPDDACYCRKPKPGLIIKAASENNICLGDSFLIGDKESDLMAGKSATVKHIYKLNSSIQVLLKKLNKSLSLI